MSSIFLYILILTISSITKVKSAENTTDPDRWVVYDNEEFDSKSSNHRLPSCILAEMKGKIETFGSILPLKSYDLFPNGTEAENYTCGGIDDQPEQKLVLNWQQDSELVMFFRQKDDFNLLHHVVLRMLIPLVNEEESYYELYAESAWDLELMRVPNLFAFVCKNPLHIPMQARVSKITSKDDTPLLSDGQLAVPTSVDYNATLELTNVKMELFRLKRHYNDFTHLQYDCEFGWPYKWVAHIIHIIVWILAILLLVNFTSRFYFKNRALHDDKV